MTVWNAALTRRDLLRLGLVTAVAPKRVLLGAGGAWSFAVFSDTHFGIPGNFEKNRALLEEMAALRPDLAIDIGDLTERGWAPEYDEAARAFSGLPFRVRVAPGNHEVRWSPRGEQIFEERVGPPRQLFEHRGCGFLLLDSTVPLSHWGHIGGPERRWVEAQLARFGREKPLFVFLHHPVGRAGGVDDQDALARVLAPYNTTVVFTGHGHSDLLWDWNGVVTTMGLGLYQGSYQHVVVDPGAGEVRVFRRPKEGGAPVQFASAPLAPRPHPVALGAAADTAGAPGLQPAQPGAPAQPGTPAGAAALVPAWTQPLGGGVMSRLLLDGGTLYVSGMDGVVAAFAAADGRRLWQARTGGYCFSSPVLAGQVAVVGSADGFVYGLDSASGRTRWKVRTHGPVYGSAAIARDTAAIASGDGSVYGIAVEDGRLLWRWELPAGPSAFAQSPAATDGERIFLGAWDTYVYALDAATGSEVWRYRATDRGFYYSAAVAKPAVAAGRLYLPSNDNTLHALDARTGEAIWTHKSPGDKLGYSSPTLVDGRIYTGSLGSKGEVRCISAEDGKELWVTPTGAEIYESSPAVAGGMLAIGSVNGTLWLLRTEDGAILGSHRFPPGLFVSTPAAAPGRAYAATFAETLVAFDVRANTPAG